MEVAEENGGLRASNDQDHEHNEEKAVHVIDLAAPDTVEHEEELDEDTAKRQNTSHYDSGNWLSVDALIRYLPGDLVGPHWLLDSGLPEAEVSSDKSERYRHAEPKREEGNEGEEGDSRATAVVP